MDDKSAGVQRRNGFTCIKEFDVKDEAVVGILSYRDVVLVATTKCVYKLVNGHFEPMEFLVKTEGRR